MVRYILVAERADTDAPVWWANQRWVDQPSQSPRLYKTEKLATSILTGNYAVKRGYVHNAYVQPVSLEFI